MVIAQLSTSGGCLKAPCYAHAHRHAALLQCLQKVQLLLITTACTPRQHAHGRLLAHNMQSRGNMTGFVYAALHEQHALAHSMQAETQRLRGGPLRRRRRRRAWAGGRSCR